MAANEQRSEVALELADQGEFILRPTFEAIAAIETQIGKSLVQLTDAARAGSMSLGDAAIIVTECVKAWGKAACENDTPHQKAAAGVNAENIGRRIYATDGGLFIVLQKLGSLLLLASTGGYTSDGTPKPRPPEATK